MIDIWTVRYRNRITAELETVAVYGYRSGGVGMSATDPLLVDAIGGTRSIVSGITAGEAERIAANLADVIAYLTGGDIEHTQLDDIEVNA
jgi:hypothetical protein